MTNFHWLTARAAIAALPLLCAPAAWALTNTVSGERLRTGQTDSHYGPRP